MMKRNLIRYIESSKSGELVYQFVGDLLSVLGGNSEYLDFKSEIQNLVDEVTESAVIKTVNRDIAIELGYNELADWSNENDVLLLVNNLLLCIPTAGYEAISYRDNLFS